MPKSDTYFKKGVHGRDSLAWKGGVSKYKTGYVYILSYDHPRRNSKGYVPEHHLVVEKSIGRYLDIKNGEVVHHINGIKDDNRIENLVIMNKNDHSRLHSPRNASMDRLNEIVKQKRLNGTFRYYRGNKKPIICRNCGKEFIVSASCCLKRRNCSIKCRLEERNK